jgi:hypothetical protein
LKKNIVSVSRRTDIPAFFGDWFALQLEKGQTTVYHPYKHERITVSLKPQDVAAFIFWSRASSGGKASPSQRYRVPPAFCRIPADGIIFHLESLTDQQITYLFCCLPVTKDILLFFIWFERFYSIDDIFPP